MRVYRSILFTPGNRYDRIQKASILPCDAVILDLEDAVPPNQKDEARSNVLKALREIEWKDKDIGVRINGLDTIWWIDDLYEIVKEAPDFIVIPKVKVPADVKTVEYVLSSLERKYEVQKKIKLHAVVEDPLGLRNVFEIANSSERISMLGFGKADFSSEVGCEDTEEMLFLPRMLIVLAAVSAGVQPIDTVYLDIRDLEGLEKDAINAKRMGYVGKIVIHPAQIEIVNKVFTPSEDEVTWARKVLSAFEEAKKKGIGVFTLEGKMIDEAVVKKARRILSILGENRG